MTDDKHHPECMTLKYGPTDVVPKGVQVVCNCYLSRKPKLTEAEKGELLCVTRKEYLRTHAGPPALAEKDSWRAVYRKALSIAQD